MTGPVRINSVHVDPARIGSAQIGWPSEPWWLGHPDGMAGADLTELGATLLDLVGDADLIVAPWPGDRHPDHRTVGRVAADVAAATAIPILAYPVWLWRWGRPADAAGDRARRLDLDPSAQRAKQAAMACFPSQTTDLVGETIVDAAMVDRFGRPFEVYFDG